MGTRQVFDSLHDDRFQLNHRKEMMGAETNDGTQKDRQTHVRATIGLACNTMAFLFWWHSVY